MFEEVEMISEGQQLVEAYKVASIYDEIPELEVGEQDTCDSVSRTGVEEKFASHESAIQDSLLSKQSPMEESVEEDPVHKPEVEADGVNTFVEADLGDHDAATPAKDTSEDVPPAEHLPWLNRMPGSLLQAPAGRINNYLPQV
jgi:hypothetical protein